MEFEDVFDDLWKIFSRQSTLREATLVAACKGFNIDLNSLQQASLSTTYNRTQWMNLLKNNTMNESMINKLTELHSSYLNNTASDNIKTDKNTLSCYQWRLPRYQPPEIALLCHAFIRQYINALIPNDIVNIMVRYLFVNVINTIKIVENEWEQRIFESGIFEYESCKFNISLSTLGMPISITLLSAPRHIYEIEIRWNILFVEKFINYTILRRFRCKTDEKAIVDHFFELVQDDIQDLKSMTFNVSIHKFVTYGVNDDILTAKNPDAALLAAKYDFITLPKLTKPAADALKLMFTRFASNEDGSMSIEDMKKYIIHCSGDDRSASNDRIQTIFYQHGTQTSAVWDRLTFEGFLNFYKYACIDRPGAVWHDFEVFNFGYDLRIKSDKDRPVYMTPIILDGTMGQSVNSETLLWKLSDEEVEQITNAVATDVIRSTIFIMNGLKFQLWLYVCNIQCLHCYPYSEYYCITKQHYLAQSAYSYW